MAKTMIQFVIVGAGFGGIEMAVSLKKAGMNDFVMLEKGTELGGAWRDNNYPGCFCDVPSHLYSFSFAPYRERDRRYIPQQDILAYLGQVSRDFGLLPHLRLETPVTQVIYREGDKRWDVTTATGKVFDTECVIFAVGQLHRAKYPDIPGLQEFKGPIQHPAVWDHSVDLTGKRVAIIGSGSAACQMLPSIAELAQTVTLYQRTPAWVLPKPGPNFGSFSRLALRAPFAHGIYRKMIYYGTDTFLSPVTRSKPLRAVAEAIGRRHLQRQIKDEGLRRELSPGYPAGSKRILFDSGFYPALTRPNVGLVTEPIAQITPTGLKTAGTTTTTSSDVDKETPVDVLICATGFRASEFLVPMSVLGRGGRSLNQDWAGGADAFMGLAVHGYPNAFIISGPNTFNPSVSNPAMGEHVVAYIMRCLRWKAKTGAAAIEVTKEAMEEYREMLDRMMKQTIWPDAKVDSWYKHESGKVTNPWPGSIRSFSRKLRRGHPRDSFQIV